MTAEVPYIDMMPDGPWATRQKKGEISILVLDVLTEGGYRLQYTENSGHVAELADATADEENARQPNYMPCREGSNSSMTTMSDDADFALPVATSPHSAEGGAKAEAVAVAGQSTGSVADVPTVACTAEKPECGENTEQKQRPAASDHFERVTENQTLDSSQCPTPRPSSDRQRCDPALPSTSKDAANSDVAGEATNHRLDVNSCAGKNPAALIPCPACLTVHPPEAECALADIGRRFEAIAELARFERRKYAMNLDLKQRKEAEENDAPF